MGSAAATLIQESKGLPAKSFMGCVKHLLKKLFDLGESAQAFYIVTKDEEGERMRLLETTSPLDPEREQLPPRHYYNILMYEYDAHEDVCHDETRDEKSFPERFGITTIDTITVAVKLGLKHFQASCPRLAYFLPINYINELLACVSASLKSGLGTYTSTLRYVYEKAH